MCHVTLKRMQPCVAGNRLSSAVVTVVFVAYFKFLSNLGSPHVIGNLSQCLATCCEAEDEVDIRKQIVGGTCVSGSNLKNDQEYMNLLL